MSDRIAIDMDEVLADTLSKHLAMYNLEHGDTLTKQDLEGKFIYEAVRADRRESVREYPRAKDFFRDIPVMPGSQEVLPLLLSSYEVFITTAAMEYPTSFAAKYEWIKEHFPLFPDSHIVFCGDKSIIAADFLIDDNAHHSSVLRDRVCCLVHRTISLSLAIRDSIAGMTFAFDSSDLPALDECRRSAACDACSLTEL